LKATAGDLIVTGAGTEQPLFADQVPTLYAAEKISLTAASDWICTGIPEMTFGQSVTMGGNTESLFIGLDQLAVEGSIDLLPLLKFISPDMEGADIVFTAALNGEQKKEILAAGTYNCNVAVTRDGATLNIPFNLIVREAKPAVNPDTGDQSPLAALVALTLASALGMGLILSGKKYSA
jgi:hypothetical protein